MIDLAWRQEERDEDDEDDEVDDEQRDEDEQEARRIFQEECDLIRRGQ